MHINQGLLLPGKCSSMAPPAAAMKNCRWGLQRNKAAEKCWAAERKSDNIWTGKDCWKGKRVCVRERKRHGRGGRKGAHRETWEDKKYEWVVGRTWKERIWKLTQNNVATSSLCTCKKARDPPFFSFLYVSRRTHIWCVHLCTCATVCLSKGEMTALTLDRTETWAEGGWGARTQIRRVPPLLQAWGCLHCNLVDEICNTHKHIKQMLDHLGGRHQPVYTHSSLYLTFKSCQFVWMLQCFFKLPYFSSSLYWLLPWNKFSVIQFSAWQYMKKEWREDFFFSSKSLPSKQI